MFDCLFIPSLGYFHAQVGYLVTGRSEGWVTPCAACSVHVKMRSVGFLVEHQNQGRRFVSDLTSKSLGRFVSGLPSKPLGRFISKLGLKITGTFSPDFASKPVAHVSRFRPQNHYDGFLV
jgi:hypothetical protein